MVILRLVKHEFERGFVSLAQSLYKMVSLRSLKENLTRKHQGEIGVMSL